MDRVILVGLALLAVSLACGPLGGTSEEAVQTAIAQTEEAATERQAIVDTAVAQTIAAADSSPQPTLPPTETLAPDTIVNPTVTATAAAEETAEGATLIVLYNDSVSDVCHVYVSPAAGQGQPVDLMVPGDMLPSGYALTFFDVPAGESDLRVENCAGGVVDEAFGVNLRGKVPWAVPGPVGESGIEVEGGVTLRLVNDTAQEVCQVWVGPPASEWIADVLDKETIPAGGHLDVSFPSGTWALMAQDCSGMQLDYEAAYDVTADTEWHIGP
jgi:hypothetical protein